LVLQTGEEGRKKGPQSRKKKRGKPAELKLLRGERRVFCQEKNEVSKPENGCWKLIPKVFLKKKKHALEEGEKKRRFLQAGKKEPGIAKRRG